MLTYRSSLRVLLFYVLLILTQKLLLTYILILRTLNPYAKTNAYAFSNLTHTKSLRKANAYVLSDPTHIKILAFFNY